MRLMLLAIAAIALVSVAGCTEYPAAIHTTMAQALPPYHQTNSVNMDQAAGLTPVQSATHNWSLRFPPFTN